MRYRLGLDIGITSVGWAVIEDNEKGEPIGIADLGVRIFEAAEHPKTGASLAEERSKKRSSRRRNRRKLHRVNRVKKLLVDYGIITDEELKKLYLNNTFNIYEIRARALDYEISKYELAAILINFVKRRGYKSNARYKEKSLDTGKVLKEISKNNKLMLEKKYRTVGEMYFKDDKFKYRSENGEFITDSDGKKILKIKNAIGDYNSTVDRESVLKEIKLILDIQKKYNFNITDEFVEKYIKVFLSQRNFDEGPAFPSPYAGNVIRKMIGKCTFEKNEIRASKGTYTFEMFKLLQDLNKIKLEKINIVKSSNGMLYHRKSDVRGLTEDEKVMLIEEFRYKSKLSYSRIRKILSISYEYIFNMINYDFVNMKNYEDIIDAIDKNEESTQAELKELEAFHKLRKTLDLYEKDYIFNLDENLIDYISTILTLYKSNEKRIEYLSKIGLNAEVIELLLEITFSNFSHLSIKAMKKIMPYLKEGLTYDKATNMVYDDFRGNNNFEKKKKLSLNDLEEITNPVVRRAISQTIKVLNAIVRKYGSPEAVNIELARGFLKSRKERDELEKSNRNSIEQNQELVCRIKSSIKKESVTDEDILKYKLWKEQEGKCMYSGLNIDFEEIFTKNVSIDYIISYSKSFDNSYSNKVLVKLKEHRNKGDMIPLEYIVNSEKNMEEFRARVISCYKNKKKVNNLLRESFTKTDEIEWKERNLKDTQYITRLVLSLIRNYLYIEPNESIPESKKIIALRGGITYIIRRKLDIDKTRDSDRHHAIDATIIAIANEKIIQGIINNERTKINYLPYNNFVAELNARMKETDKEVDEALKLLNIKRNAKAIFISRMPNRKVRGLAHRETINGISKSGNIIVRKKLTELKLNKDNEIEGYYNKKDDRLLYDALRAKLIEANGNAKLAFSEPFFKPKSDGTRGPIVNKVKLEQKSSSNVKIEKIGGVAGNGDTVRIDVFYIKDEGYYFVPIYVSDTIKKELPNRACISNKNQSEWKIMKEQDFIFSLYSGDLIYIKNKRGFNMVPMKKDFKKEKLLVNEIYGYYIKCGINSSSIALSTHDRKYWQPSLGIRGLECIKKYEVDVLGNYSEIRIPEKRMRFNLKR